jgi:DNA-binding winged helix-turn-helix (wHTH) protein
MSFGPFRLIPARRLLLEGQTPVRLGSRALEILIALVERPGALVWKDELLARAWPGMQVIEGNLKFQVGTLRRALGDGRDGRRFIESSRGQGYRFVADVSVAEGSARQRAKPVRAVERNHNPPARLGGLVGRGELIAKLVERGSRERLLTIVGPGGIGKTSVAIAVAEQLANDYEDGVWMIDLLRVADETLVGSAVAAVLGVKANADDLLPALITALRDRRMLIVLDNCAHVIEAAAQLALAILQGAPGVHILATSRQPLHVETSASSGLAPSPERGAGSRG